MLVSAMICSLPVLRAASTAALISPSEAIPVEMMIGLPLLAAYRMSGRSTISLLAILYAGTSRFSR